MEFRIAHAARVTGEMLERGVRAALAEEEIPEPDCVICYGAGYAGPKPSLNAKCSSKNKMEQGETLQAALNYEALRILVGGDIQFTNPKALLPVPVVGRKIKHSKGKDMRVCQTGLGVQMTMQKGRQFFTPVVLSDTEYRVWVYRKRILAVYEKQLTEPELNVKFGRNRANGYTFHAVETENIPAALRRVSIAAVAALDLDFGAVDVLGTWNGTHTDIMPTVLEVNSAPGVSDERRTAIVRLIRRIVSWIANNCPERAA